MAETAPQDAYSCRMIYRTNGLPHALRFILNAIQPAVPAERINVLCSARDFSIFLPLADTMEIDYGIVRRPETGDSPVLMPEKMNEPCIVPDLGIYQAWLESVMSDSRVPLFRFSSMLRLPLFSTPEYYFSLHFFSTRKDAFKLDQIAPLQELVAPLADELGETFASDIIVPDGSPLSEKVAQMRECPNLEPIIRKIEDVASSMTTVMITGETGTGKELVADAIHSLSPRAKKPFIKVNCGAIAETLVESELFGHEKGAFTGAQATRPGYFEMAKGGSLFLDEIGEMQLASQAKLLRVLDSGQYFRVGNPRSFQADVRIIAATNRNLEEMVREGRFRQDLYYRLCVYPIHILPLRERPDDIRLLARHFIEKGMAKLGIYGLPQISEEEYARLVKHDWPGNVRELEFVIERTLLKIRRKAPGRLHFEIMRQNRPKKPVDLEEDWPTLDELKNRYISKVIEKTNGRLSGKNGAAAILGVHYTTLNNWLKNASSYRCKQQSANGI